MKPDVDAYQYCNKMRAQVDVPIASSYSLNGVSPYVGLLYCYIDYNVFLKQIDILMRLLGQRNI